MAKDPAFLFYPNDWIGGTMGMTFEEKGAYMEVLMMQFNRGHMTEDMIGRMIGHIWVNIKHKFKQDEQGLWYNVRLDIEHQKRKTYTESRRNNRDGKNQYSKKEGHMTSHMENENENRDKIGGLGGRKERAKAISEDGEYAIFEDGSMQPLTLSQQSMYAMKELKPEKVFRR